MFTFDSLSVCHSLSHIVTDVTMVTLLKQKKRYKAKHSLFELHKQSTFLKFFRF